MQPFEATAQAGMAEGAVAAAIAGQLVDDAADLRDLLIDVQLPRIGKFSPVSLAPERMGGRALIFSGAEG